MQDDFDESKMFSQNAIKPQSLLEKYYRLPGLNVNLPSKGRFITNCHFEMDGTIAISPMKSSDDMILKNPDALMSGSALESLFASCVPSIPNPREISLPDIDVLLIAIRVATYGPSMKLEVTCPVCKEEYEFSANLSNILATAKVIDDDIVVQIMPELCAVVRPYNLINATRIALTAFEQSKLLQNLSTNTDDAAAIKLRSETMEKAIEIVDDLNNKTLTDCILEIRTPEGTVTNKNEIFKFISNTSKAWKEKIEEKIKSMNEKGVDKTMHLDCPKCQNKWDSEFEIDPTNFFDASS